ncbi:hypothetical protein [Mesotoga sp.]|uniref:hypothetical protein n=1 Tax=Mesotoga sp. TaxID=2053577 RepID=UPI00261871E4|nr:hypothetical protein [Mesotoga sp.]
MYSGFPNLFMGISSNHFSLLIFIVSSIILVSIVPGQMDTAFIPEKPNDENLREALKRLS